MLVRGGAMSPSAMLTQYPSEGNWDPSANGRGLSAWRLGWWEKLTWQGIYIPHFLGSTVPNHQIIPLTFWSHEAHAGARLASGGFLDTHCSRSRPRPAPSVHRWVHEH